MAPVTGVITLDGSPLPDVTVSFIPDTQDKTASISTGRTDASGKYTLETVLDQSKGAVLGKHFVRIAKNIETKSDVMSPEEIKKSYLPPHEFTFEVKSGANTADFNLESKKGKR